MPVKVDPFDDIRAIMPEGWKFSERQNGLVEFQNQSRQVVSLYLESIGQGLAAGTHVYKEGRGSSSSFMQQSIYSQMDKLGNVDLNYRSSAQQTLDYVTGGLSLWQEGKADTWLEGIKHVKAKGDFDRGLEPAIPVPQGVYDPVIGYQGHTVRLVQQQRSGEYGSEMNATRSIAHLINMNIATSGGGIGNALSRNEKGEAIANPNYVSYDALRRGGYGSSISGEELDPGLYYWGGFDKSGYATGFFPDSYGKDRGGMRRGGISPEYMTESRRGKYRELNPLQPGVAGSDDIYQYLGTLPSGHSSVPAGERGNWVFGAGLTPGGIDTWHTNRKDKNIITGFSSTESTNLTIDDLHSLTTPGMFDIGSGANRLIKANSINTRVGTFNKPGVQGGIPINIQSPITDMYLRGATLVLPLRLNESETGVEFGQDRGVSSEAMGNRIREANPNLNIAYENVDRPQFRINTFKTEPRRFRWNIKGQEQYTGTGFNLNGTDFQYGTDEIKTSAIFGTAMWGSRSIKQRQGMLSDWAEATGTDEAKALSSYYDKNATKLEGKVDIWENLANKYTKLNQASNPDAQQTFGPEMAVDVFNKVYGGIDPSKPETMARNERNKNKYGFGFAVNEQGGLAISYPKLFHPEAFKLQQDIVEQAVRARATKDNVTLTDDEVMAKRDAAIQQTGNIGAMVLAKITTPELFLAPRLTMLTQGDYNARNRVNPSAMTAIHSLSPTIFKALGLDNEEFQSPSSKAQYGFTSWRMFQDALDQGGNETPQGTQTLDVNQTTDLSAFLSEHGDRNNLEDDKRQGSPGWVEGITKIMGDPDQMSYYPGIKKLMPSLTSALNSEVPENMGESVGQAVEKWSTTHQRLSSVEAAARELSPSQVKKEADSAMYNYRSYQESVQRARGDASKELTRENIGLGVAGKYISSQLLGPGEAFITPRQVEDMLRKEDPSLRGKEMKEAVADFYKNTKEAIFLRDPQLSNRSAIALSLVNPEEMKKRMANTPGMQEGKFTQMIRSLGNRIMIGEGADILSTGDKDGDPGRLIVNAIKNAGESVRALFDVDFRKKIVNRSNEVLKQAEQNAADQRLYQLESGYFQSASKLIDPGYKAMGSMAKAGPARLLDALLAGEDRMLNKSNMAMSHGFGVELSSAAGALGLSQERQDAISNIGRKLYQEAVDSRGSGKEAAGFDQAMALGWAKAGTTEKYGDYLSFGTNQDSGKKDNYSEKSFFNLSNNTLGTAEELTFMKKIANVMARQTTIDGEKTNLLNAQDLGEMFGSTEERAAEISTALENTKDRDDWGTTLGSFFNVKDDNLGEAIQNTRQAPVYTSIMDVMYRKSRERPKWNATKEEKEKKANERRIMDYVIDKTGMQHVKGGSAISSFFRRYITGQGLMTPDQLREAIGTLPEGIFKNMFTTFAKRLNIPLERPDGEKTEPVLSNAPAPSPTTINEFTERATQAAQETSASQYGADPSYYNPTSKVLGKMGVTVDPEDDRYIKKGYAVHDAIEPLLKEKLEGEGWTVKSEHPVIGKIGGRKVSARLDIWAEKEDPDNPGQLLYKNIDVKSGGGAKHVAGQLSVGTSLAIQSGEREGKQYSSGTNEVVTYTGGSTGLKTNTDLLAAEAMGRNPKPVKAWNEQQMIAEQERLVTDQNAIIEQAAILGKRSSKEGDRHIAEAETKGDIVDTYPDVIADTSKQVGRNIPQPGQPPVPPILPPDDNNNNSNNGPDEPNGPLHKEPLTNINGKKNDPWIKYYDESGEKVLFKIRESDAQRYGIGGGTGKGGKGGFGFWPKTENEIQTAMEVASGSIERVRPYIEQAIASVYAQVEGLPNPAGGPGAVFDTSNMSPDELMEAANMAGITLKGSAQLAYASKAARSIEKAAPAMKQWDPDTDTNKVANQERYDNITDARSSQTSFGKLLQRADALGQLTGSTIGSSSTKGELSFTAEEMAQLTKNTADLKDKLHEAAGATKEHREAIAKDIIAITDSSASIKRTAEMRAINTEIENIRPSVQPGVASPEATRMATLLEQSDKLQAEEFAAGAPKTTKGINMGGIARKLTSGWGLMYMQSVIGAIAGGGDYGSQEAQGQYAQTAGLATTMLGESTIGATMTQRIAAAKARVGGISPRDSVGLYMAEHPGAESAWQTGKASAMAFAGTEWALGMLPAGELASLTSLSAGAIGGIVAAGAAATNFGMQVASQTPVSIGNWLSQNPEDNRTPWTAAVSSFKNFYANPAAASKFAWAYVTGNQELAQDFRGIESLNLYAKDVVSGATTVERMKSGQIRKGFGDPSEQQVISAIGTELSDKYKADIESSNRVAALIDLNGGRFDPTQATRLLAQEASGVNQMGGLQATYASRGMTQQDAMRQALTTTLSAQKELTAFERAGVSAGEAFVQAQPAYWQPDVPRGGDEYNKWSQGYDLSPMRGSYLQTQIGMQGSLLNLGMNIEKPTKENVPSNVSQYDLMQLQAKYALGEQYSQGILGGDSRMWGTLATTPGVNLQNLPDMQTTFGGSIGAEYAAFTGYNMAGRQTGGNWGRESLQMGGVSSFDMAQRIYGNAPNYTSAQRGDRGFGPRQGTYGKPSDFSEYGKYGQGSILAQRDGVALDNGEVVGGVIGDQQWRMEQQYDFSVRGLDISRRGLELSGASLGISYKQLAQQQAFATGVGLNAYSGTVNPQTGQPFGFSTGNYSFSAPGGYNFASQGGGEWGLQDAQRNLGYAQTEFGFQMQQKQMNLQTSQFGENMGMQAKGMALGIEQGTYQYQYGTQMAEHQFSFGQTMYERQKRFLTGYERQTAELQNKQNVETYNMETDNRETQFGYQKQQWKLQEEQFQLQIKQFGETKQLQEEQLTANKKFYEINKQLQEESVKLSRASWVNQIQLQKESLSVQAAQKALQEESLQLQEDQMDFQREMNGLDLIAQKHQENVIDAINHLNADTFPTLLGYVKDKIPAAFADMINKILAALGSKEQVKISTSGGGGGGGGGIPTMDMRAGGGDILPGNASITGDSMMGYATGFEELVYARPGGGASITPVHGFSALASNNAGPSPENNTIIKRSNHSTPTTNNVRVFIGNREITDFIIETVEGEFKYA